jgi:hypothetical protein
MTEQTKGPRPGVAASMYPSLPNSDAAAAELRLRRVLPKYEGGARQRDALIEFLSPCSATRNAK